MQEKSFFIKYIPTLISLLAIWLGVTAIRYSFFGEYVLSASLLLIAAFLDGIDGRVARKLNVSSSFGVEIDSLADAINFGVSPAFIVYFWRMNEYEYDKIAWFTVLLLISCIVIRLARFNVDVGTNNPDSPLVKYFFKGMPAPATASMIIFPLVLTFCFGEGFWSEPFIVIANTIVFSLFAMSTIPTPCFKKLELKGKYKKIYKGGFYFLTFLLLLSFLPKVPISSWFVLSMTGIIYLITIAIAIVKYIEFKKELSTK
jgi:CDP-diacylglycerol--serine O-phosphatidyltransferase